MINRFFVALIVLSFLTGCGAGDAPQNAAPIPSSTGPAAQVPSASASNQAPALVAVSQPASVAEIITENPDFKEDRKVYEKDSPKVLEATVILFEKAGASLKNVDSDIDPFDDYEPKVEVLFQEGDFGKGLTVPNGTMKIRGMSTRKGPQKSYKISLIDKTKTWRDQTSVELSKHPYDLTRVRNKLSFDVFKTLPHMGSLRTQFIHLTIKKDAKDPGKDYGLFSQIENSNKAYLSAHGLDPEANLYFAESFSFQRDPERLKLETDPGYKKESFGKALSIAGSTDHSKILAMLDDVNNDSMDIDLVIKKHFNLNNYLTWFAMNILMENLDTTTQNFTLYSPKNVKGWYFLPWDYDDAWGFVSQPGERVTVYAHRWIQGVANWWQVPLHRRFLKKPENIKALQTRIEELMKTQLSPEAIKGLLKSYHDGVKACVSRPPDLTDLPINGSGLGTPEILAQYETEFDRIPTIIEASYKTFVSTLGRPMPFHLGTIQAEENQIAFYWDKSYSLTGDQITYDFLISKTPVFEKKDLLFESLNLTDAQVVSDTPEEAKFRLPRASLPMGTLYLKVVARSSKNPQENWQAASEFIEHNENLYDGVRSFTKP